MEYDVRSDVLMLLGIGTPTAQQEGIVAFLISETEEAVRAYCRIETVPDQLGRLIAQMVVRQYRQSGYGSEKMPTEIKSVTEGAQSVSFAAVDPSGMLNGYRARLRPYVNRRGKLPSEVV